MMVLSALGGLSLGPADCSSVALSIKVIGRDCSTMAGLQSLPCPLPRGRLGQVFAFPGKHLEDWRPFPQHWESHEASAASAEDAPRQRIRGAVHPAHPRAAGSPQSLALAGPLIV